jgi:hypothetical protein
MNKNPAVTFLRILQLIVGIIIIPFLFELVTLGNALLALWYANLKWIWIIIGGFSLTIMASSLITVIFTFIINLIKRNSIAPKILNWILIPIIALLALYKVYIFWDETDFDNGKQIFSFFAFLTMTFYSATMIAVAIFANKFSDYE